MLAARRALVRVRLEQQDFPAARALAESCLALARELHGTEDARAARDLVALANVALAEDRTEEAAALLGEATRLTERAPSPEPEDLAAIASAQASLALERGAYEEAAALYARGAELETARCGADHHKVTVPLEGLAEVRQRQGDLERAAELLARCLAIRERAYGPEHPRVASLLNSLGVVRRRQGDYAGAVEAYRRALAIKVATYGADHPDVATTMVNLSAPLDALGESAEALDLLRRAVAILEAAYGPEHTRTAWALSHLAQMERGRGNAREAEPLFRRCLAIAEAVHGPHHPDVASYRLGIAQCLTDEGRLEEARRAFEEAISTAADAFGAGNHEVARYERELGVVLLLLGRAAEARRVLERSAATLEAQLGADHPALVRCLSGLTVAALAERRVRDARRFADRRLAIAERTFGEAGLRGSLLEKVAVEVAAREWDAALAHGVRALRIALAAEEDILHVASEREALLHAGRARLAAGTLVAALHATVTAGSGPPDTTLASVFTVAARAHGQVLDRLAERRQLLDLAREPSAAGELGAAYVAAAERLANRIGQGPRGDPERFRAEVARAREDKEDAERALTAASERYREQAAARQRELELTPRAVVEHLPAGAVLVQLVRFPRLTIGTRDWRPGATSLLGSLFAGGGERYGAFVLRAAREPGWSLRFVDLGEAARLDSLVLAYRRAVDAAGAGARPPARLEAEYRAAARRLYEQVWAPLAGNPLPAPGDGAAEPAPMVLLVPTSWLHLVDFNTLISPEGDLVIERFRVHLLSSARDLLRSTASDARAQGHGLLAVGNPAGEPPAAWCPEVRGAAAPLPQAEEEAREVAELFTRSTGEPATLLVGAEAAEGAVKRAMAEKRLLHLATHGFFCQELAEGGAAAASEELRSNPLSLCGLVLAPGPSDDDGLLTAEEIVTHDLRGLDWVVLSACGSGLGSPAPGEGLLGLRRAFEMAGARTVLMALWAIGDVATRDLMARIYAHRLAGRSTADALRLAELERLDDERRRFHRLHPARWGGVVAEGDWR